MKYLMSAEWWKAAGIRAAKTMFQTGAALVVTQMPGGTVERGIRLNGILGMDGV